jgi:signal-transduction protein with cAMP-binding, CBS, and nucleotidyltransferase domain
MPRRKLIDIVGDQELLYTAPDAPVQAAAEQMAARHVAAILVVEDGALKGIFTERDLLQRVVAVGLDPANTSIAHVMTPDPISLDARRPGFEAMRTMHEEGIRHIVLTGLTDGYGVVSMRDFLASEVADFEKAMDFQSRVWDDM